MECLQNHLSKICPNFRLFQKKVRAPTSNVNLSRAMVGLLRRKLKTCDGTLKGPFVISPHKFFPMQETKLTLEKTIHHVRTFHESFGLPVRHEPTSAIPEKESELRYNLMKEENEEYLEAVKNGDLVEIADALGDMLYILCGTINAHGLQEKIAPIFEEIQRSNMSKLDSNGKPIYREDGKVLKSELYFRPDIASILR